MPGAEILSEVLVLLALSVAVTVLFHRFGLPPIVGFLLTGVLCGPGGLGLVKDARQVEILAELGVVLLLFTVGIELSLEKLVRLRWLLLFGGGLQVVLTAGLAALLAQAVGVGWAKAVFLGLLVSLSSTAIVLRIVSDRGEVDTAYGRACVAILIFQDLCIVPMVLLTPFLAGKAVGAGALGWVALKAVAFVGGAVLAARYAVPWAFRLVVHTRLREVFVLTVAGLCLGAAWSSAQVGLSLALGAFIAGLILSQSEYGVQALGDALPFREVFNSLFFISVGLLLDVRTVVESPGWVLGTVAAIVALKTLTGAGATLVLGYPVRVAAAAGLSLSQIGEFSFVLSRAGVDAGILGQRFDQLFLAAAVITMALTPWLHRAGLWAQARTGSLASWRLPGLGRESAAAPHPSQLRDHVVIVGYGVNGRNLGRVLTSVGIPYMAVEMNPYTVRDHRRLGVPILYGDATAPETLAHAGIQAARVMVVAVSDAAATRRVVALANRAAPRLTVIARTRYVQEVGPLQALGAHQVIPEEFETSVEIFARVLQAFLAPRDVIERCIREIRKDAYEVLREPSLPQPPQGGIERFLTDIGFETFRVDDGSPLAGLTLGEARLRSRTGATLVALQKRGGTLMSNPDPATALGAGDLAMVLGTPDQLTAAAALFRPAPEAGGA